MKCGPVKGLKFVQCNDEPLLEEFTKGPREGPLVGW
jgi:hypothetical protein